MNTLLRKPLPEAPGKEIEVITVNYPPGAVDAIHLHAISEGLGMLSARMPERRDAAVEKSEYTSVIS